MTTCPKCGSPLDHPSRRLCVSCIPEAVNHIGANVTTWEAHDNRQRNGVYSDPEKARQWGFVTHKLTQKRRARF